MTKQKLGVEGVGLSQRFVKDYANSGGKIETTNTRVEHWNSQTTIPVRLQNFSW